MTFCRAFLRLAVYSGMLGWASDEGTGAGARFAVWAFRSSVDALAVGLEYVGACA